MSWDGYIDNVIAHSQDDSQASVDKVCIIGLDGGAPWTSDQHASHLKLNDGEGPTIASACKRKDFTIFRTSGIVASGVKYMFLREADGLLLGKKKDLGAITLGMSNTAIVIAHTVEGSQQGNSNNAVLKITEYLVSVGM